MPLSPPAPSDVYIGGVFLCALACARTDLLLMIENKYSKKLTRV